MLPLPTASARAAFVGAVLMLAIGVAFESATAVVLASSLFLGLAAALAFTLPLGARLRADRLELSWWHTQTEPLATRGAVVIGAPFELRASLRHPGPRSLELADLRPAVMSHVRCIRGQGGDLVVPPGSRVDFGFTLVADAAGRVVLHGLSLTAKGPLDLFRAPLYFPCVLVLKALPRAAAKTAPSATTPASLLVERVGQSQRRVRGGGSELRELRELLPGDPFKSIAWKASAKSGQLLVREVESEVQETFYVIVDVSGTMRGGTVGARKLDHAIEIAALAARKALERGDRAGVITVDGRIVSHAPAREGVMHLPAIHEALLAATEIVDQDLAELDDDELIATVARYLRRQDGVVFDTPSGIDVDALVRHAVSALGQERDFRTRSDARDVVGSDRRTKILRRFCRARGIALPYRTETRGFGKGLGLGKALREAAGKARVPRTLMLISDFDGTFAIDGLQKTLRLLRAERHALLCVYPDARALSPSTGTPVMRDLELVYGLAEERRLRETRTWLGKLGVPLLVAALGGERVAVPTRRNSILPTSQARRSA